MKKGGLIRKIFCWILAAGVLFGTIPFGAYAYEETLPYTVYQLSFNDGSASDLLFNLETKFKETGNGNRVLSVVAGENNEIFKTTLTELQSKCKSRITLQLKSKCETTAKVKLIGRLLVNNIEHDYVLDSKIAHKSEWIGLSGTVDTTFINSSNPLQLLISVEADDRQQSFEMDNFTVVSGKESLSGGILPVPDIKSQYDGNLLMRASFEKPTLNMFYSEGGDNELITDEVPAHSGKYSLKCHNRTADWECIQCRLFGVDPHGKFTVSAWVKKDPSVASMSLSFQEVIKTLDEGFKWRMYPSVSLQDDEWHYLEATIDGNAYPSAEYMGFRITPGDGNRNSYYVDDLVIKADIPGELYDDMDYVEGQVPEGMSATPNKPSPLPPKIQDDIPVLKDVFKDYFKIGACCSIFSNKPIESTGQGKLIAKHFNNIVHDGAMKTANTMDQSKLPERVYTFKEGDVMMDFAYKNGIEDITGHTLFWESKVLDNYSKIVLDNEGNLIDLDTAHAVMKEYISAVIRHFEGDGDPSEYMPGIDYSNWHISVWDVVNEAVYAGDEVYAKTYGFSSIMGSEYIYWMYKYANDLGYDDIQYRYNDYGEQDTGKRIAVYDLVKRLRDRGLRVDCVGLQSHYRINVLPSQIRKALEYFSSLGIQIDATELDLSAYTDNQVQRRELLYEDGLPIEVETAQANFYYELFQIYKEFHENIGRITFWSIDDANSYQNRSDEMSRTDYAGIFDRHYQAKPQFWAIADPEYYFANILKEDTTVLRVVIDGITLEREKYTIVEKDGVTYMKCSELLEELGIEFVNVEGKYSFIGKGTYVALSEGQNQEVNFESYEFNSPTYTEDGELYVPIMEVCASMGYTTEYNERRNIVGISSNQVSNSL